jgi:hypothetical protein
MIDTVCIVGHGPSLEGKALGKFIDEHECVIRMSDCAWQNEKDYGKRSDIIVFTSGPSHKYLLSCPIPRKEYWHYMISESHRKSYKMNGKHTRIVNPYIHYHIPKLKEHHLSRGAASFLIALYLYTPECINLAGFDAIQNGEYNKNHHPKEMERWLNEKRVQNTHDWQGEKELIERLAEEKATKINWL